jgi:hypothetical protein
MTLTLRPMNEDEFGPWYAGQFVGYEEQLTEFARMPSEAARRKAKADLSSLLGERGLATDGHSIYVLDDEGKSVGDLWVHEQERAGERFLWVYDVTVDPTSVGAATGDRPCSWPRRRRDAAASRRSGSTSSVATRSRAPSTVRSATARTRSG